MRISIVFNNSLFKYAVIAFCISLKVYGTNTSNTFKKHKKYDTAKISNFLKYIEIQFLYLTKEINN